MKVQMLNTEVTLRFFNLKTEWGGGGVLRSHPTRPVYSLCLHLVMFYIWFDSVLHRRKHSLS